MGILSWLFGEHIACEPVFGEADAIDLPAPDVNPATGLPMMDDATDVMGNPYGAGEIGGLLGNDTCSPGFGND